MARRLSIAVRFEVFVSFLKILRRTTADPRNRDHQVGENGEDLAARHLRRAGFTILHRNWRCRVGELDLVCRHDDTLVFVEVKTSARLSSIPPAARVAFRKQAKLRAVAKYYVKQHAIDLPSRFDVIAVWWENREPKIEHIENAFA